MWNSNEVSVIRSSLTGGRTHPPDTTTLAGNVWEEVTAKKKAVRIDRFLTETRRDLSAPRFNGAVERRIRDVDTAIYILGH